MNTIKRLFGIVAFVTLGLAAVSLSPVHSQTAEDAVAIEVNGETLKKSTLKNQINRRVQRTMRRYGKQIQSEKARRRLRKQARQQVIKRAVDSLVLETMAAKQDISIDEEAISQKIQQTKQQFESEEQFYSALEQQGMSMDEFRGQIETQLKVQEFLDRNLDVSVTNQEVRSYYNRNTDRFQDASFDDVKENIRQSLEQKKRRKKQQAFIQTLRDKSEVNVRI